MKAITAFSACLFITIYSLVAAGNPAPLSLDEVERLLNSYVIPRVEFREVTMREAVDYLNQKTRELEKPQGYPAGFSLVWINPEIGVERKFSYSARNVPLLRALTEMATKVKLDVYLSPARIIIIPHGRRPFSRGQDSKTPLRKLTTGNFKECEQPA